jgi:hypothetical protein
MHGRDAARRATVVGVTAAALAVGSCGGEDGPTKAEFTKEANAVCKRHYVKISAAASKLLAGGKLPTPREFGQLAMGTIIPEYSAQIRELRDVEPPEKRSEAYEIWLKDSDSLRGRLQENPALIQQPRALSAVNGQADRLGLSRDCHIGPG